MHIVLFALLCVNINGSAFECHMRIVADSQWDPELTVATCIYGGQQVIASYLSQHPRDKSMVKRWGCQHRKPLPGKNT